MQRDLYETQNAQKLGDTANDIICYEGNLYVVVNNSQVLLKLNGSGVEQARFVDFKNNGLGSPRYVAAHEGKLYVTCYGGYIARFDANTLAYEDKVAVDANPEEIEIVGTKAYCVCSGFGMGKTICSTDLANFSESVSMDTEQNPMGLKYSDGHMYVLTAGTYNDDWSYKTYPRVCEYDIATGSTAFIADASRVCAVGEELYAIDCNHTPHTYYIYNARTKAVSEWELSGMPEAFNKQTVYMIEHNAYDNTFFIGTTDYVSNSSVYHFRADGTYIGSFSAGGLNANGMVFVR